MHYANDSHLTKNESTSQGNSYCSLPKQETTRLYMLSLMLTADVDSAESCLVSGLSECMSMRPSLSEWTNGWARRVLVQNAIQLMQPAADRDQQVVSCNLRLKPALHAVMRLKNLERFVFVLSVLEGYSDRECAVLLGPSAREIMAVKVRSLENLVANVKSLIAQAPRQCGRGTSQGALRATFRNGKRMLC